MADNHLRVVTGDVFSNDELGLQDDLDEYEDDDYEDVDDPEGPGSGHDKQGVFAENQSIFSRQTVNPHNPVVTPAGDPGRSTALVPTGGARRTLSAVWTDDGKMVVATTVNGQRVENWRYPTEAEWNLLKTNGRITKSAVPIANAQTGSGWGKIALGAVILAAVGGAGWYAYKKYKGGADEEDLDETAEEI